ncbi:MAG: glucose-1-phosphate adenylyltransferase [Acidobacteriota bacterium]
MDMVGIIMAGGQGSRLYPLTKVRSKPAVPLAGRFRLIDVSISNCIHSNVSSIFVLTQFATESLHRHIFTTYRFDGFHRDFITLLSAQQTFENRNWYQGTADAVRQNLDYIKDLGALVLVLSGDHLYRMDYRKFAEFHAASGAEISIGVTPIGAGQAGDFGIMKVDGRGRITEFREKPRDPAEVERLRVDESVFERFGTPARGRTHLASMGVYLFSQDVLRDILARTGAKDFGREVIPQAIGARRVFGHFFDGYREDIGTIRSFFEAHMDLTRPLPRFDFYDEERPVFTQPRFLPGSKIVASDVRDAVLCEGSIVNRSYIRNAIIGIRSRIGENARLERTVVMGADYYESREDMARNRGRNVPDIGIGSGCEIRDAIIDKNARIGRGVRLVNAAGAAAASAESCSIVDGIIVVPKDAVIPDGTVI